MSRCNGYALPSCDQQSRSIVFPATSVFCTDRKSTRPNSSHPPRSTLFPYTALFRSSGSCKTECRAATGTPCHRATSKAGRSFFPPPACSAQIGRAHVRTPATHRDLHSSPTRRSSDLLVLVKRNVALQRVRLAIVRPAKPVDRFSRHQRVLHRSEEHTSELQPPTEIYTLPLHGALPIFWFL